MLVSASCMHVCFVQTLETNSEAKSLLENIQSLSSSAYRGFDPEREAVLQVFTVCPHGAGVTMHPCRLCASRVLSVCIHSCEI